MKSFPVSQWRLLMRYFSLLCVSFTCLLIHSNELLFICYYRFGFYSKNTLECLKTLKFLSQDCILEGKNGKVSLFLVIQRLFHASTDKLMVTISDCFMTH